MSTKYITICDCCGKEIDINKELYEDMQDNVFGVDSAWKDVCETCMCIIRDSVQCAIGRIQKERM